MKRFSRLFLLLIVILVAGVSLSACRKKQAEQPAEQQPQKKKISKPINEIPVGERPYVVMAPTITREIDVTVKRVVKEASKLEYLAEYQYGTSLGGNENFIDLSNGLPATRQFALYSRSAGGKTSYEEDVQGGTLQLMFSEPNEYWLKQEWRYFDNKAKDTKFSSKDAKFQIEAKGFEALRYVIVYNSPGYPAEIEGRALSDVYTFQYAGSKITKTANLKMRMNEEGQGTIMGWNGEEWKEFKTTVSGKEATAQVDLLEAYVVVAK